jgi:hypothetical protein
MDEKENQNNGGNERRGDWRGHNHYGGHRLLRIVIGVLILLVVFWLGVKLGELRSELYRMGGFGRRSYPGMMGGYGGGGYGGGYPPVARPMPMMGATPAATTSTAQ